MAVVWWVIGVLTVLTVVAGLVEMWRAGRPDTSIWSRETTLYHAFQFTGWARCIDRAAGLASVPDDPSVVRLVEEHWIRADSEGALLVAERAAAGSDHLRLLYLWARHAGLAGSAHYLANVDHIAFDHGSRGAEAAAVVRAIVDALPGVRAAWVSDERVGVAFEVEEVTAPSAWTTWLLGVAAAVPAGGAPSAPPSRWSVDRD